MAKIYGLFGAMTGKLADTVMSVRNGEQLARKYQPVVFNPSTPAQIAQRAKLKLMSQLSAVLGKNIAMRKQGPVSSRNLFTKKNIRKASFTDNNADIDLTLLDITGSAVGLPPVSAQFDNSGNIDLTLTQGDLSLSRVVYLILSVQNDRSIRLTTAIVQEDAGENGLFPARGNGYYTPDSVVLAYGVRDNTEAARTIFGELTVPTALDVARIVTSSNLTEADVTLTETRGAQVAAFAGRDAEESETRKKK